MAVTVENLAALFLLMKIMDL